MPRDAAGIPQSAKYTAATWSWGKLRYADVLLPSGSREVFHLVNLYMALYRCINPRKHSLPHTLLHRHGMIDHLLRHFEAQQVIELAAGFSPRGAAMTEQRDLRYYEVDLLPVVQLKTGLLNDTELGRSVLARSNFRQIAADVMQLEFASVFPPAPSFIISEGLMMYFNRREQIELWQKIAAFTRTTGSCYVFDYIPLNVEPPRSWIGERLHRLKARRGAAPRYSYDERTHEDVRNDLLAAGFRTVELHDSQQCAARWSLPNDARKTRVLIYECR
jgi:O-methyltransferase involved in polyketide biosynthesis